MMPDTLSEGELLGRCINDRDADAWEFFVTRYSRLIWGSIRKTCRAYSFKHSEEDLEDLFHSVFLALMDNDYRKLRQFRKENSCSLSTWLAIIASRLTIDHIRKDRSALFVDMDCDNHYILELIPAKDLQADQYLEQKQIVINLKDAAAQLPDQDRLIFRLHMERGLSAEETAGIMNLGVETVYSRKNRIIGRLKKSFSSM